MSKRKNISDSQLQGGHSIIAGTSLSAEFVLDNLVVGRTPEQLCAKYPGLTFKAIEDTSALTG